MTTPEGEKRRFEGIVDLAQWAAAVALHSKPGNCPEWLFYCIKTPEICRGDCTQKPE
jgi:hypothetical protein